MLKKIYLCISILLLSLVPSKILATELVIGEERIKPGIVFIFEGAIKDTIHPKALHLAENNTHVHIEARVNWDSQNIPEGAIKEGFIPYLHIVSTIKNERTGLISQIDLVPHINLIDNFHYARNISLPGEITDSYTLSFEILPPQQLELSYHKDWIKQYKAKLMTKKSFTYYNVNFKEIASATRK